MIYLHILLDLIAINLSLIMCMVGAKFQPKTYNQHFINLFMLILSRKVGHVINRNLEVAVGWQ